MVQIPYEIVCLPDPRKAPKAKLPYIKDGNRCLADSSLIIRYLKQQHGDILDQHLTPKEQGMMLGVQRLVEEHLYWVLVYSRWLDDAHWPRVKKTYFGKMALPLRAIVASCLRKKTRRDAIGHGMARHSQAEIYQLGADDIHALSDILGDQDFFMGNTPCSLDATCYGFLANILQTPVDSALKAAAQKQENLSGYVARMHRRFFATSV